MPATNRIEIAERSLAIYVSTKKKPYVGVDAAARIHSSIAGPVMMRNTPPPLASNDLFGATPRFIGMFRRIWNIP